MRRWLLVHTRDDRHVVAPLSEVARQVEHHGANPPPAGRIFARDHGDVHGSTTENHHLKFIEKGTDKPTLPAKPLKVNPRGRGTMGDVLPVSVTVILPTRNEEEALAPTIDAIPRGWCKDLEIMIVDGNSSDRTREIALEKNIRVHLEPRKGYGRAYRTGFDVASTTSSSPWTLIAPTRRNSCRNW